MQQMILSLWLSVYPGSARAAEVATPDDPPTARPNLEAYAATREKYQLPDATGYQKATKSSAGCTADYARTVSTKGQTANRETNLDVDTLVTKAKLAGMRDEATRSLRSALNYVMYNPDQVKNQKAVAVADYSQPGTAKRLFVINIASGKVQRFGAGQGIGTTGDFDPSESFGKFSNKDGSRLTAKGCMVTGAEAYYGSYGTSYNLHGLNDTNSQNCNRRTVMHPAGARTFRGKSYGCLALKRDEAKTVNGLIGGGGVICTYPGS